MRVPFLNLKAQYESIADEVQSSILEVLSKCAFSGGPYVEKFEEEFAAFCGSRWAAGVGSGTDALWLTLLALGVGPGDEVVTVPNSFIATAEAISLCGARPVFVDIDEASFTMDPALLAKAITERTKVIIPVHLYGQTADMDPILAVADRYGIAVLEDACQAHGAEYKGRRAGSLGHAACFSFYPGKNLGAYGEAGCVVSNDEYLVKKIKMLRDHGQSSKYYHNVIGTNGRMDGIQGAVLTVKLKYLHKWNDLRRSHALLYRRELMEVSGIKVPREMDYANHVYHVFAVRCKKREEIKKSLNHSGIECGVHYPVPIHLQEAYIAEGQALRRYPIAELCAQELLSLPMFPELTEEEIRYICQEFKRHANEFEAQ